MNDPQALTGQAPIGPSSIMPNATMSQPPLDPATLDLALPNAAKLGAAKPGAAKSNDSLAALASLAKDIMTPAPPKLHDVTVLTRKTHACARVEGVPPEEFGIARNARSIRDAGYCFHEVIRREADLIAQGFDRAQVCELPGYNGVEDSETLARDTVDEQRGGAGESLNSANREVRVTEHYVRMDYEGTGRAALYRVTTGGEEGEVLTRDGEPDIVEVDTPPFAAMTPVIVTHRFFGRSIADLVMDIQRIKTALLRGALDNLYLHNNPRVEVSEAHAGDSTLDDLLVSRPGGIVRTKMPGGLNWQVVPDITTSVYPALQYFDATREWRTGVSRQGQGVDPNALQNQVATIANQMADAAAAKLKLIARIFAETGIRDMFALLHGVIRRNGSQADTVRLRNAWVTVNPREWRERNDMTINVGLGSGSKSQQLAHVMSIIALQKEALAAGKTNLVSDENLYNAAKEVTKLVGLKNVDRYFTDPQNQPPPQPGPDPMMLEMATRTQLERLQAQALDAQNRKTQADIILAQQKFELEKQLKLLDAQIKAQQHQYTMAAKVVGSAGAKKDGDCGCDGEAVTGAATPGAGVDAGALVGMLMSMLERINAPKRIVRDAQGRVSHVEPMAG